MTLIHELLLVAATNALVTVVITGFVKGGLHTLAREISELRRENQKVYVQNGNLDHRLTQAVKKIAALELIVTRAHEPRLRAVEKAANLEPPQQI